jgi:hypothetical protein
MESVERKEMEEVRLTQMIACSQVSGRSGEEPKSWSYDDHNADHLHKSSS